MMQPQPNSLLLVDLETSGPNPAVHVPLAVAFVPLLDDDAEPLVAYIKPDNIVWTPFARANFGRFSEEWNSAAQRPSLACSTIEDYLDMVRSGSIVTLIGHNVGFDLSFLNRLASLGGRERFTALSHRSLDIHTLLYLLVLQGRIPESALSSDGAFEYFGVDIPPSLRHTAIGDALATKVLFLRVMRALLGDKHTSDRDYVVAWSRWLATA
jgi:DNA polymerase III subunit epsilon